MGDENDEKHLPNTSASTPNSTTGAANSIKAPKDRNCPFCGQAFTSSSLGRHLDLYIKAKNPKPPDGVHDVDEIKKLRGNITRRQARTSTKGASGDNTRSTSVQKEENGDVSFSGTQRSARHGSLAAEDSPIASPTTAKSIQDPVNGINAVNWLATGVINNLPPRAPSRNDDTPPTGQAHRIQEMRRDASGNRHSRPEPESESMWKLQQDAELGRAAEMALREVLGSLEAAQKRVEPKAVFEDVDFYSLSFPGLCLAILPPPSTLFSPTPFPSADSWTLGPPGLRQFEAMNRYLHEAINNKRKVDTLPDSVAFKHHAHLSGAWEHWQNMSEHDRTSAWTMETLRSFTRMQDLKRSLRAELEQSQQHVRRLEAEYDRLSRCQLPREYLMHPINTIPVAPQVMRELKPSQFKSGVAEFGFDAEALLSKWKTAIRATQRPSRIGKQNSHNTKDLYAEQQKNNQMGDAMVMNGAIWNINGPMPRHRDPHSEYFNRGDEAVHTSYGNPPHSAGVTLGGYERGRAAEVDEDAEGEADENTNTVGSHIAENALIKRQRQTASSLMDGDENGGGSRGLLNPHGKRPFIGSPGKSGKGATKVYKAHEDGG